MNNREEYFKKLNDLKSYYDKHQKGIIDLAKRNVTTWYVSYITDYKQIFSPIEFDAWCSIRSKGRIVLYPQYPVGNFYVDFGNPFLKIALELDGKEYHLDKGKDQARDKELNKLGWTVFRITGKEMQRTNIPDSLDLEGGDRRDIENWIKNTGDGVIEAMRHVYFLNYLSRYKQHTDEYEDDYCWFLSICESSLNIHNSNNEWRG